MGFAGPLNIIRYNQKITPSCNINVTFLPSLSCQIGNSLSETSLPIYLSSISNTDITVAMNKNNWVTSGCKFGSLIISTRWNIKGEKKKYP